MKLTDVKSHLEDELNERDRLTNEASSLTESLGHCKVTLHEAQQHRGTLNATVATIAHEKADLMREKVSLRVQVGTLEDELNALKRKFDLVNLERERLEQKVKDSERRVFLAELNRSVVSREGSTSNVSSTDLKRSLSILLPHGNEGKQKVCERLLGEYEPLCDTVAQMKRREIELQEELDKSHLHCETQMKTLRASHAKEIASVKRQQEETHATWRNEMQMLRKKLHEQQQQMQSQLREVQLEAARKSKGEHADDCAKWQSDLKAMQIELSSEKERASEADEKLVQLSAEHSRLSEQLMSCLKDAQNEMESLRESNVLLLNSREEISSRMVKLADVNQALEQSLASTTEDLEKCRQQLQEIEAENERLGQCQLQYEEKSRQYSRDLVEMETQQSESQRHCEELQREKEDVESALLIAQKENTSLESQLLAIKTDMASELETSQLCQSEAEGNYSRVLSVLVQVLEPDTGNPLHGVGGSTPTLKTKRFPDTSPEVLCQGIVKLKNERDDAQNEMESLRESNVLLLNSREEISSRMVKLADVNQALEQSLASTTEDLEKCRQQLQEIEAENERLGQCQLQYEEKSRQYSRDLVEMETQQSESQRHCEELQREKEDVESALLIAQKENTSLESQLLAIKTDMASELETSQLCQSEAEGNYSRVLSVLVQVLEPDTGNPLHGVGGSTPTLKTKRFPDTSPEVLCQGIVKLKNERDELRKAVAQNTETLEQCRRDLECMKDEKCAVESQVRTLQSSLASLQASLEMISRQRDTAEVSRKEAQACLDALQTEKGDLEHQTSSLQRQLDTLNTANNALQQKCRKLEQRLMEVETLKNTQAEETLQLKNMVSILKSSQLNKDRKLTELEQRFQSTQREMVEKEVDHRGTERSRSVLEQRLAHFEQSSARQEGTKKELQSRVQYLESQLTEIQEKAQCLRRDVQRLQRENLSLTGDVENLSKCLETTTQEKQTLAQSLEMEIERLREEVGRLLHVNSSLKVQLVHNRGNQLPLCMDPAADGLLSASRTQLQRYIIIQSYRAQHTHAHTQH